MSAARKTSPQRPEWLDVGYVARAHGLKGTLIIKTFDPTSTALGEVDRVRLTPKEGPSTIREIDALRDGPGGDLLLDLATLTSRNEADALVGSTLAVHRDELDPPEPGEVFQGDLVGLAAFTRDGAPLGTVTAVWATGPVPNLVVTRDGHEELVPFAEDFVLEVDLEGGRIVLAPPVYEEA